jgi:hypothetical protein
MSVNKATNYLDKKDALPKICADRYPPKDSVVVDREVSTDTLYLASDTIPCPDVVQVVGRDTIRLAGGKVACPPAKVVVRREVETKTVYQENTAKAEQYRRLDVKIGEVTRERDELAKRLQRCYWIIIVIVTSVTALVVLRLIFKKLTL